MSQPDVFPHYGLATPPQEPQDPEPCLLPPSILESGLQVLLVEARAIASLAMLYRTNEHAQNAFTDTVNLIARTVESGGKLVVCGIGKSGKIAQKFVATMNSLSMTSIFLHASEAMHGDLGLMRDNDALLLISFSGSSPELVALLPHFPRHTPRVLLTGNVSASPALASGNTIFLPAPIDEPETASFGVCAPTTSTTVALALCDALAIATAKYIHDTGGHSPAEVFAGNHPGGAIGQQNRKSAGL